MTAGAVSLPPVSRSLQISRVGISEDSAAPIRGGGGAAGHFIQVGFSVLDLATSPDGSLLAVAADHGLHFLVCPGTSVIIRSVHVPLRHRPVNALTAVLMRPLSICLACHR